MSSSSTTTAAADHQHIISRWAAEATMAAPIASGSNVNFASLPNPSAGRGSKESSAGNTWAREESALPDQSLTYDSTSVDGLCSFDAANRRNSFLLNGLRERPMSMLAAAPSPPASTQHTRPELRSHSSARGTRPQASEGVSCSAEPFHSLARTSQVSLKSCLKSGSSKTNGTMDEEAPITSLASAAIFAEGTAPMSHKSVHISDDLPKRNDGAADQSLSSASTSTSSSVYGLSSDALLSSPLSSPVATRLTRRNAAHRRINPDARLSRAGNGHTRVHSDCSPISTRHMACDSDEEDEQALTTPLDDRSTHFSGNTPPTDTLDKSAADRVGITRGIDQLGATNAESVRLMTQLHASHQRYSKFHDQTKEGDRSRGANRMHAKTPSHVADATPTAAPSLSLSTLLDIGRQPGLTPPTSRDNSWYAAASAAYPTGSHPSSMVVSAGLEMGLGVRMASSALANQLPPSSSSGLNSITEPRFSRGGASLMAGAMEGLKLTKNELPRSNDEEGEASHAFEGNPAVKSDRAADEVSFAELDRDDAELNRRRTTGGLQARRDNRSTTVGKRRVVRTGTQDPHGAQPVISAPSSSSAAAHSRHTSVSTMVDADEALSSSTSDISSMGNSSPLTSARLTHGGTTSTPIDTPSHGHKALLSPSIGCIVETGSLHSHSTHGHDGLADDGVGHARALRGDGAHEAKALVRLGGAGAGATKYAAQPLPASAANNLTGGLMGIGEVGHFGPGVRAKAAQLIASLIDTVPLTGEEDETVQLCEYGALNSRSGLLLRPAISALAKRAQKENHAAPATSGQSENDGIVDTKEHGYFDGWAGKGSFGALRSAADHKSASRATFCVMHEDTPASDFRPLTQILDSHPESYLDAAWQSRHAPCLTNAVFPTFASRPFASRLAPPRSLHLGISLMDLHWTHTPVNAHVGRATTAQAELTAFLKARASEFKKHGLLVLAYIARSEDATEVPSSPLLASSEDDSPIHLHPHLTSDSASKKNFAAPRKDIWTTLSNSLAPCIQRLVSCGMLKSDVARHLLDLPMHPRTARQTQSALKSVEGAWKLEWSCGLGQGEEQDGAAATPTTDSDGNELVRASEPRPLRLAHPAWKAYESGCLSSVPFTEHIIQLFKNLYESHFRAVLREKGRLSKGAVEFVLDSLWDALFSRIVDQLPSNSSIKDVEIEVCIYALRRR